ncbi:MAG: HD domain-containing protein [Myxococcales bacterium]
MILRDPVHGLVAFEGERERVVQALVGTPELQRLRRVRQLGLASLVFPGAEHSRFAHAIGTGYVMGRLLDRIAQAEHVLPPEQRLDAQSRMEALAAAVLHDLGHGPFSHLYEDVLPGTLKHEDWTEQLIANPDSELHRALETFSAGTAARVAQLVRGKHRLGYLGHAVSGTLDVDRCDYLLRDSLMTGVRYGVYDLDWLLRALSFGEVREEDGSSRYVLAIEGRKGLPPIEGFFLARHFMYQQVYHHKAVRAAEALVRGIFARAAELSREGASLDPVPVALIRAAREEVVTPGEYLMLDDAALTSCIAAWQQDGDALLADLCRRFMARALPKTLPLPDHVEQEPVWRECHQRASEIALAHGFRPDLYVWLDVPRDVPYAEPKGAGSSALWVSLRHRPMARLGDVSFLLRELRNKRTLRPRLVFPAELREQIVAAVEPLVA